MLSSLPSLATDKADALLLRQDSVALGKGATIELSPGHIEVNAIANGVRVVSKAPTWEVFFVRPSRKIYSSLLYKQVLSKTSLLGDFGAIAASGSFKLPREHLEFQIKGNRFFKYRFPGETFRDCYLDGSIQKKLVVEYFVLVTLQNNLPEQEAVILSKLLSLPVAKGIPYSFLRVYKNSPPDGSVVAKSLSVLKAREPDFSFIKEFRRAKKDENVLLGDSSSQVLEELFQ